MSKTVIVVLGPTGIGKSDLSIRIAQHFHTEIISADSRQIYKELAIGTAVPPADDLQKVKHHLIHNHSIHDYYSAALFEKEALETIDELFTTKDVLVVTGGSMMYIDALCKGMDDIPDADQQIRAQLMEEHQEKGLEHMRLRLKQLDPVYYEQVDLKNPKRILHALEVCLTSGKPYSSMRKDQKKERPFNILKIGLNRDRQELYDRINRRVDLMMEMGLEDEAKSVFEFHHLNSLNTVGYKELFAYFEGQQDKATAVELIKRNSRHYARKQLTWFRRDQEINWFQPEQEEEIIRFIDDKLTPNA
ncbi:tRNA (adenosine(37)-N6)-dimethylallyltransferase MiaA [Mangrovibacterium diazotrophicum]|uniref:tRNA dimethylallyltransferase n=1 Tax=Mangrovibacterium diazotrophicum TaxID=1261403 RepID=A0A419VX83_9BACT|nr:tRNA (adenosine(37)-N6)-dimethylallyltransferase MiaA [Mangrovibacterium diazotrophicum]RKD87806.1 tRNA dimethylallyltransferase [Mangrovibacterium diazotrophicum]